MAELTLRVSIAFGSTLMVLPRVTHLFRAEEEAALTRPSNSAPGMGRKES